VDGDKVLGPTWAELFGTPASRPARPAPWWQVRRAQLLDLAAAHECAFVYDPSTLRSAARALRALKSIDRVFYAMKANPFAPLLRTLVAEGLGVECVSRGELEHAMAAVPGLAAGPGRAQLLYTPNFAARAEYAWAFAQGVHVTIDNLYVLRHWPELFRDREVLVRIDTGTGRGHHQHVRTAGVQSKFGIPLVETEQLVQLAGAAGARVVGLHAHPGSGVFDVGSWSETASALLQAARLGVPDSHEQAALDLEKFDAAVGEARRARPELQVWLEPGRFLVASAGVLLVRVTQTKSKAGMRYVGVSTGMNSLIRPALYGAWHEIVNLTRLDEPATELVNVVGPICESADFLGHDRLLPRTLEDDVLLIANAGAYGHSMSSHYNLRAPAPELMLPD
jgi:diaminopimelate decarboxylase/aspartate kinase